MPIILDIKDAGKLARRRRTKRTRPVKPPVQAERDLRRKTEALWVRSVFPAVQRIQDAIERGASREELAELMEAELRRAESDFGANAPDVIDMWRLMVDQKTRERMHSSFSKALGVDLTAVYDDPEVADALAIAGLEASDLITNMPGYTLGRIARAVSDNMRGVELPEGRSLRDQIEHIAGVDRKRAQLIARDQTNKLTSSLNQTRQQMLGVEMYRWRTSRDEAVVGTPGGLYPKGSRGHHNHFIMEGLLCRWDDASVYSSDNGETWKKRTGEMPKTHPGMEIQCRCYAEPMLDIDKILKKAKAA